MDTYSNDTQDIRITRWLDSLKYDCSEDTRFSLLCPALDALLEQFEQEYGPISKIGNSGYDRACQDSNPITDVQRQEQKPETDESKSETEKYEHRSDTTVTQPDPESEQIRLAVLSIFPSTNVDEAASNKNKPRTDSYTPTSETVAAKTLSKDETKEGVTEDRVSEQIDASRSMTSTLVKYEATNDRQQIEKRLKRKRKHRHEHHNCSKKARQDYNNNYSSLDARLEQFYVCPLTNRLIPKLTPGNVISASDCSGTAEHSDNARHTDDLIRCGETNARHREKKPRTRPEIPRPRGFRKGTSLLKKATTRCLIRKALETGTFCCYRRCFLTKPVIYI